MDIKDISALLDSKLDSKLEPILNELSYIKTEIHAIRIHTESTSNRLAKLENRMANIDSKLDVIVKSNNLTTA